MGHKLIAERTTLTWPLFKMMMTGQIYKKQFIIWLRWLGLDCTMTLIAGVGVIRMRKLHSRYGPLENQTTTLEKKHVVCSRIANGMIGIVTDYFHFFAPMVRNDGSKC